MNYGIPFAAILLLAACETPSNPSTTAANGVTAIQIQTGRNCYDNRCFTLNANGTVQLAGRNPARIPAGINYADGTVTPAEFEAMLSSASSAYASGVGRR